MRQHTAYHFPQTTSPSPTLKSPTAVGDVGGRAHRHVPCKAPYHSDAVAPVGHRLWEGDRLKRALVIAGNWRAIVLCGILTVGLLGACGGRTTATAPPTELVKATPTAPIPTVLTPRVPGHPACPGDRPRAPFSPPAGGSGPSLPLPQPTGAVPTIPRPAAATTSRTVSPCPSVPSTPVATHLP